MLPLQFLCGLLCDETVWSDIPRRMGLAASSRIVSFGGLSSIGAMADFVLQGAPAQFALAGHSMGGRVALEVWRRAPQRVTALALLNTGVKPTNGSELESRRILVRLAQTRGMAALASEWLPPLLGASAARTAEVLPLLASMVQKSSPAQFANQTEALLARPDARPVLPTIRVPTLLICGANDSWSTLTQHADMQRTIPRARLVEIAGAGHMTPIERPDAVARALKNWLTVEGAGS